MYLKPVDQNVIPELAEGKYFRYADDITIIDDSSKIDRQIDIIRQAISKQGLELNDKKERRYDAIVL